MLDKIIKLLKSNNEDDNRIGIELIKIQYGEEWWEVTIKGIRIESVSTWQGKQYIRYSYDEGNYIIKSKAFYL